MTAHSERWILNSEPQPNQMKTRLPLLVIMAASFGFGLLNGAITGHYRASNPWHLMEKLTVVTLIYWWYHCDKIERQYQAGKWLNVGVVALAVVAVPIYLFQSRGAKGGALATVLFVVAFFGFLASLGLGAAVGKYVFH